MENLFELSPVDGRKSFYGKCHVSGNPFKGYTLHSYGTPVARLDCFGFTRLWSGYSVTTMRHINAFMVCFDLGQYGGKAWWQSLPVNTPVEL